MAPKARFGAKQMMPRGDQVYRIILIVILVCLIIFAVMYMYNIMKMSNKMEKFENSITGYDPEYKVVYIYSSSCPHCTSFTPTFEKVAQDPELSSKMGFVKYEFSEAGAQPHMSNVDGFPTVLVYQDGQLKDKSVGSKSVEGFSNFLQRMLS